MAEISSFEMWLLGAAVAMFIAAAVLVVHARRRRAADRERRWRESRAGVERFKRRISELESDAPPVADPEDGDRADRRDEPKTSRGESEHE